jgi:hypothetical protein
MANYFFFEFTRCHYSQRSPVHLHAIVHTPDPPPSVDEVKVAYVPTRNLLFSILIPVIVARLPFFK